MTTKKQNRRHVIRQVRRALNRSIDFFKQAGGRKLNGYGYGCGCGVTQKNLREKDDE